MDREDATECEKRKVVVVEAAGREAHTYINSNQDERFKKDIRPLAKYSYDQWETLGREDAHFTSLCGYSNPVTLGVWLYEQCLHYGVEFRIDSQVVSADLSSNNEIVSIGITSDGQKSSVLACNKIVLATGSWTPAVFKKLFPDSSVKLEPVISAGEWFVFENPEPDSEIAAAYFDDIVGEKLEFAGRNDHTIWVTGVKTDNGTVPDLGEVPKPDPASLAKLKAYSDNILKHPQNGLRVISQGRSYRPENRRQVPVIAGIPASQLSASRHRDGKTSVYINLGHGSYGVTLGMGSGKVMSQLVLGKKTDVNVSSMGVSFDG
ncbi:MAG: hypothetical protein Q9223_001737 [Gallowayella weberi]